MKKIVIKYSIIETIFVSFLILIASQKQKINTTLVDCLFIAFGVGIFIALIMLIASVIKSK